MKPHQEGWEGAQGGGWRLTLLRQLPPLPNPSFFFRGRHGCEAGELVSLALLGPPIPQPICPIISLQPATIC